MQGKIFKKIWKKNQWGIDDFGRRMALMRSRDCGLLRFFWRILRMRSLTSEVRNRLLLAAFASTIVVASVAMAQNGAPGVIALTPDEMKWQSEGGLAAPGLEQLNLVGDPAKPGPYTIRLRFPKGFRIAPHSHPDAREVTILSGTYATGYGERFDPAKLKTLPAGSFYTEPANMPHYIEIKEDAVLQVSGTGPSGRKYVNAQDGAK
jgi:quercetin dioxygenase-like cupin family protein